jgi:hypothetical protein
MLNEYVLGELAKLVIYCLSPIVPFLNDDICALHC